MNRMEESKPHSRKGVEVVICLMTGEVMVVGTGELYVKKSSLAIIGSGGKMRPVLLVRIMRPVGGLS